MNLYQREDFDELKKLIPHITKEYYDSISNNDSIFHMHIPKTGGTFFWNYFKKLDHFKNINFIQNPHFKCDEDIDLYPDPTDSIPRNELYQNQKGFEESIKIAIVRNPFDWLLSWYNHSQGDPNWPWLYIAGVGGIRTIYNNFEDFVNAYCDDSKYWPGGLEAFRKFYPFQIFDSNGNCRADFIFLNGSDGELNKCCLATSMLMGLSWDEAIKPINEKVFGRKSRSKSGKTQDYYSMEMYEKLYNKWKNILEVFNFDIGGLKSNQIILNGNKLKYCKEENRLWIKT